VRLKPTIQAKLVVRLERTPMVDKCMEWIRTERVGNGFPGLDAMQQAWESAQAKEPANPLFAKFSPVYASNQCAIHWKTWLAYENKLADGTRVSSEDAADEDGADAADGGGGPSEEHAVAM
jgi:hypothetical protein